MKRLTGHTHTKKEKSQERRQTGGAKMDFDFTSWLVKENVEEDGKETSEGGGELRRRQR